MPKKKSVRKDSGKKSKKIEQLKKPRGGAKAMFWAIIILIVVLVVLIPALLFQFGLIENPFIRIGNEKQLFYVEDECSMIIGNLIHTINDEGSCEQQCTNNCEVREMDYVESEFVLNERDCHTCKCYCI